MGKKVLIVGGGPAGLSAAYYWSKEGYDITLYEASTKEKYPEKPCGEAIPKETLEYIPVEKSEFILNHIKRSEMYMYGKKTHVFEKMPLLEGYIIDKRVFLLKLAEAAEAEGAKILWGKKLTITKAMSLLNEYDYILDATGKGNIARAYLDYSNYEMITVAQAYAKADGLRDDTIILWGTDYGYAWIFPRGDLYNIGIGGYSDINNMIDDFKKMLDEFELTLTSKIKFSTVSVGGPLKKLVKGKIRVLGEAAGMVMPTTGEGIRFALYAGKIVLHDNYEKLFWKKYGKNLKHGRRLLNMILRIRNKYKLAKVASDEDMYAFFEGTLKLRRAIILFFKYMLG